MQQKLFMTKAETFAELKHFLSAVVFLLYLLDIRTTHRLNSAESGVRFR